MEKECNSEDCANAQESSQSSKDLDATAKAKDLAKADSEEDSSEDVDEFSPEMMRVLPPDVQKLVTTSISLQSMGKVDPIAKKLNPEHITMLLSNRSERDKLEFKDYRLSRLLTFLYTLVGIAVFVFLTLFMSEGSPGLYETIIKTSLTFVGGLGVGYGIGRKS